MAATSIGPIGAQQINTTYYVYGGGSYGFDTIQDAVNFVRTKVPGGSGQIVVVHGHGYGEDISTITGGDFGMFIVDQRDGADQRWIWNGTNFIPKDFFQEGAFVTTGPSPEGGFYPSSISLAFDAGIFAPAGAGAINVTSNPGQGLPLFSIVLRAEDGVTPTVATVQCGIDVMTGTPVTRIPVLLKLNAPDNTEAVWLGQDDVANGKGMGITAQAANDLIIFQGRTIGGDFDQTLSFQPQGGDILFGANASIDEDGNLQAANADFATCNVDGSPVVTFENIGDVGGMVWPPVGVPVSIAGGAWGTSINPATLASWPAAGIPVSTGTAWSTPINPTTLASWPAAGIPVSTGVAWGTPINPADVPHLSTPNVFAAQMSITAPDATTSLWIGQPQAAGAKALLFTAQATTNRIVLQGATSQVGFDQAISLNPQGGSVLINNVTINPATLATWPAAGIPVSTGTAWGTSIAAANVPLLNAANTFTATQTMNANINVDGVMRIGPSQAGGWNSGTPNINCDGSGVRINGNSGGGVFLNWDMGALVVFGNGASGEVGRVDTSGNAHFNGAITAGTKSFLIPHPLDETKDLMHGCLEGPEHGVYYRGEGATEGGWAEITLPDYFEALTMPTSRTVLLTALFDDEAEQVGMLAASRVKDAKFKVWSALPAQKFYWEVKAVRADIEPLQVETARRMPFAQSGEEE